jgi:hypothetical protein
VAVVSLYTYVNPVIAVALGTLLLDEPFHWTMVLAGATIVLVSSWSGRWPGGVRRRWPSLSVGVAEPFVIDRGPRPQAVRIGV